MAIKIYYNAWGTRERKTTYFNIWGDGSMMGRETLRCPKVGNVCLFIVIVGLIALMQCT